MATLTVNVDDEIKREADLLFRSMGMNMTTAINVFLRKAIQTREIPFRVTAGIKGIYVDPSTLYEPMRDENGIAGLPSMWDEKEDAVYDTLY